MEPSDKIKHKSRMSTLKSVSLFKDIKNSELRMIEQLMHERKYLKGEIIFDENEEGQAFYLLESGAVEIRMGHSSGRVSSIALGAGDFFGEMSLIDSHPRTAQALAVENSCLLCLFRQDFLWFLEAHKSVGAKLLLQLSRHFVRRLRNATERLNQAM